MLPLSAFIGTFTRFTALRPLTAGRDLSPVHIRVIGSDSENLLEAPS
jgi:hypothetical protein